MKRLLLALVVVACSKSGESKDPPKGDPKVTDKPAVMEPPPKVDEDKAEVPAIGAPTGMFGCANKGKEPPKVDDKGDKWALPFALESCPSIPAVYGGVTFGMDKPTVQKTVKGLKPIEGDSAYMYTGKHPFKQQYSVRFNDKTELLDELAFRIDQKRFEQLEAAWGKPVRYKAMSDEVAAWFNPEAKIKVTARKDKFDRVSSETKKDEEYEGYWINIGPYTPLAELLGAELVGKPVIGKTAEELQAMFPQAFKAQSKEEAQAQMDRLGLDAETQAKAKALGAGGASIDLHLFEHETNRHHTFVQPDWEGGKITGYSFSAAHGKDKALETELLAIAAQVLGKPIAARKQMDDVVLVFAAPNNTQVEIQPSILGEDWTIKVRPKQ